ncbi:MAG TPA: hypothetical protein VKB88_46875 [Bryobacteraceae bacterium]|nr:hypothetical protein [Bryobacteraceae bacterium]
MSSKISPDGASRRGFSWPSAVSYLPPLKVCATCGLFDGRTRTQPSTSIYRKLDGSLGQAVCTSIGKASAGYVQVGIGGVIGPKLSQDLAAFSNTSAILADVGQLGFSATDTGAAVDICPGAWGSGGWNGSFTGDGPTGMGPAAQLVVNANVSVQYDSCTPQAGFLCPGPFRSARPDR